MFRTLFRLCHRQIVVPRNRVRRRFHPTLEVLEDRFAPAIIDWTAGIGDNFNVAADWTVRGSNPAVHRVPGPGDDAVINLSANDAITFTESHEVNSLDALVSRFQMSGNGTTLTLDNLLANSRVNHLVLGPNTVLQTLSGTTSLTDDSLIAGSLSVSAGATLAFTGGTSTITVDSPLTGLGTYSVAGGTVSVSSGVTVDAPANFVLASGAVGGVGTFQVPNAVTVSWTGGTFFGTTIVDAGGTLSLSGGNEKILSGGALTNNGTVTWAGNGRINAGNEAVVNNNGIWDIQSNQSIVYGFGNQPTFNNAGTVRKSVSTVDSFIDITFNNSGALDVQTGNLYLFAGISTGGIFTVAGGSLLDLTNGHTQNISGTYTGSGAGTVRLSGGTLNVLAAGATFNFPGSLFQWTGGSIAADAPGAALTNNGTLNLSGADEKVLNGITFNNTSTLNWGGSGRINAGNAAVLNNSGTWAIQGDLSLVYGFGEVPAFNNAASGIVRKTAGSLTAYVSIPFNNSDGTAEVQSGNLFLFGGTSTGGTYNAVNAGTLLDLTGGHDQVITGTYTGSGSGTVRFSGGTLLVPVAGATLNFPAGLFQWTGGSIVGGGPGAALTNSGTLNLSGADEKVINGLIFNNLGTLNWAGTGRINTGNAAVLNNSGTWTLQDDLSLVYGFGDVPAFNNAASGVVRKTAGSLTAYVSIPFNNNLGTVEVQSGNLFLFGGTSTGGTYNAVNAGTVLDLTNGQTQVITGPYTGSGNGTVRLSGGTLLVSAAGATLNFPAGLFQWTGGSLAVGEPGATLTNSGDLTIAGGDEKVINALTLSNTGTVTWRDAGRINAGNAAVVNNSGTWTIQNDRPFVYGFGLVPTFNNSGTLTKSAGLTTSATSIDFVFNNSGTVNVNSGVLQLNGGGTHNGTFKAAAGAFLQFSGGTHTLSSGTVLPSDGLTQVTGGATVIVTDVISVQTFGLLNGTLHITSTGILNVGGNYDQTTSGSLVIEIGGTTAGAGFGQLNITGTANLAGAFTAVLVNDFAPDIGQSFPVLTCGSRNGTFNGVYLPGLPPGERWDTNDLYSETGFTLTVIPS